VNCKRIGRGPFERNFLDRAAEKQSEVNVPVRLDRRSFQVFPSTSVLAITLAVLVSHIYVTGLMAAVGNFVLNSVFFCFFFCLPDH
jgi:hypothetical protein